MVLVITGWAMGCFSPRWTSMGLRLAQSSLACGCRLRHQKRNDHVQTISGDHSTALTTEHGRWCSTSNSSRPWRGRTLVLLMWPMDRPPNLRSRTRWIPKSQSTAYLEKIGREFQDRPACPTGAQLAYGEPVDEVVEWAFGQKVQFWWR